MIPGQSGSHSRANDSDFSVSGPGFVFDHGAFLSGSDTALSMREASSYMGSRSDGHAAHLADHGVEVGGVVLRLPTFAFSRSRRKTSVNACRWLLAQMRGPGCSATGSPSANELELEAISDRLGVQAGAQGVTS